MWKKDDADSIKNTDSAVSREALPAVRQHPRCATRCAVCTARFCATARASVANTSRAHALAVQEHRAIYDAVAAHDADRAEQLTIAHIHNARAHIVGAS